jgi:hypothetical protein
MISKAKSPDQYYKEVPADRKEAMTKLRETVKKNLPKGFQESIGYGMVGFAVPHSIYPKGYHCNPEDPLPFVGIASQKNFIALYHMGLYAMPDLLKWFTTEYPKHSSKKLDMGKSCIRFKKPEDIPFKLIGELMKKVTVKEWINVYESNLKR